MGRSRHENKGRLSSKDWEHGSKEQHFGTAHWRYRITFYVTGYRPQDTGRQLAPQESTLCNRRDNQHVAGITA